MQIDSITCLLIYAKMAIVLQLFFCKRQQQIWSSLNKTKKDACNWYSDTNLKIKKKTLSVPSIGEMVDVHPNLIGYWYQSINNT